MQVRLQESLGFHRRRDRVAPSVGWPRTEVAETLSSRERFEPEPRTIRESTPLYRHRAVDDTAFTTAMRWAIDVGSADEVENGMASARTFC